MTEEGGHRELVDEVGQDIVALKRAWSLMSSPGWLDVDLTGRQLRVLIQLRKHGPTPMHRIGEWIGVSPSSSTSFVDRLEERGLVERVRREIDRRVIEADLSAGGRDLVDRLVTAGRETQGEILGALTAAELADLRRLVRRLIEVAEEVARSRGEAPPGA